MARAATIGTKNLRELQKAFRNMSAAVEPSDVNPILIAALNIMREKAVQNLASQGVQQKTGTLVNFLITSATKSTKLAGAWLKADAVKKTGAANAKHAHLIEYGHVLWTAFVKGYSGTNSGRVRGNRKAGLGHQIGSVRAFPYFRPALDSTRRYMTTYIRKGIQRLLKSAAIRNGFSDNGSDPEDTGWVG